MKAESTRIYEFGTYLAQVADDFDTISTYIDEEGLNKSGFTGALSLLTPALDIMQGVCNAVNRQLHEKMIDMSIAMQQTAQTYGQVDYDNVGVLEQSGQRP